MPIYEYQCNPCGGKFEKLVRSMTTDREPKVQCPKCGSDQTVRALSLFAVGAEGTGKSASSDAGPMCGRCGGPGPCTLD